MGVEMVVEMGWIIIIIQSNPSPKIKWYWLLSLP